MQILCFQALTITNAIYNVFMRSTTLDISNLTHYGLTLGSMDRQKILYSNLKIQLIWTNSAGFKVG